MQYLVRLAITVEADGPEDAVIDFVEALTSQGTRKWAYRVEDPEDPDVIYGYYDGYGEEIDIDAALAESEGGKVVDLPLPEDETGSSDAELFALARDLKAAKVSVNDPPESNSGE